VNTRDKVEKVKQYVKNHLQRGGLTSFGTFEAKVYFRLGNHNQNFTNAFQVDSEEEAKEIVKEFTTSPVDDIFKNPTFDESKDLFLYVEVHLPI
jgi:hypothetical protein